MPSRKLTPCHNLFSLILVDPSMCLMSADGYIKFKTRKAFVEVISLLLIHLIKKWLSSELLHCCTKNSIVMEYEG